MSTHLVGSSKKTWS